MSPRNPVSATDLSAALSRLAGQLGKTPSASEWQAWPEHPCNYKLVAERLGGGSWTRALQRAGVGSPQDGRAQKYGDQQLLEMLRRWAIRTGQAPTGNEWNAAHPGGPREKTFRDRFGTWTKALAQAGLASRQSRRHYAPDELLLLLKEWHATHGEPPTKRAWTAAHPGGPSEKLFEVAFGSWSKAMAAADLPERTPAARGQRLGRNRRMVTGGDSDAHPVPWEKETTVETIRGEAA